MVISTTQRTGNGSTTNINRFDFTGSGVANGVRDVRAGTDPNSVLKLTNSGDGSSWFTALDPNRYKFPVEDFPTAHFNMIEGSVKLEGTITPEKIYRFPIPQTLNSPHTVNFNDAFSYLGAVGEVYTAARTAAGNLNTGSILSPLGKIASAAGGFMINTFKGVAMEQPEFLRHTMAWKLSPKTPDESMAIQRMITSLKAGSSPRKTKNAEGSSGRAVLWFPKVYAMYFYPNTSYMYKFKPAVITSLSVDYAGGNPQPSFYRNTFAPESVIITLQMLEMEYWLAEDFGGGTKETRPAGAPIDEATGLPTSDPFAAWNWYK